MRALGAAARGAITPFLLLSGGYPVDGQGGGTGEREAQKRHDLRGRKGDGYLCQRCGCRGLGAGWLEVACADRAGRDQISSWTN